MSKEKKLLTFETQDFMSDKDRIKYVSSHYKNFSIVKAFGIYYNEEISDEIKSNYNVNTIHSIDIGQLYLGIVEDIDYDKCRISFSLPGVKYKIICKDFPAQAFSNLSNYLVTRDNKMFFEVREFDKKSSTYYVSILSAYYKIWQADIAHAIKNQTTIKVQIDKLILSDQTGRGGYLGHTIIENMTELTNTPYTHTVFIPGSQIVLNIETDFEKWVGEVIEVVPQKFSEYMKNYATGMTENSLVCSRKQHLQNIGKKNLADIYNSYHVLLNIDENSQFIVSKENKVYSGHITGIINSTNKTGIFIELDNLYITGLMPLENGDELFEYKIGDPINVVIDTIEEQEGRKPIIYNKSGKVLFTNIRLVFKKA